jgi:glycosyltransferase involved in cell wall biosynthesis
MSQIELLHPELIKKTPVVGGISVRKMEERVQEAQQDLLHRKEADEAKARRVSVVIRTLNEAGPLFALLLDFKKQDQVDELEIVVVDNASSDNTVKIAHQFDATVRNIPRGEFNYPKSMNLGMEATSHDTVFLTVGHALLSNRLLLAGGARHLENTDAGGVFARTLLGVNASRTEKTVQMGALGFLRPAHRLEKAGTGVLAATNCMISKEIWRELGGYDESYEMGGEDGAMAKRMLAERVNIVEDPVVAVHHSHNLGPINYARQVRRWMKSADPHPIDLDKVSQSRPDLKFI